MSNPKIGEWLSTAEGVSKAMGAIVVAVTTAGAGVVGLLNSLLSPIGIPDFLQGYISIGIVFITCVFALFFLVRSYGGFARESRLERPENFTLVAVGPNDLIGRTEDLERLQRSVAQNRIVLLDGESGCGKSAIISSGLVPVLRLDQNLLPVLVRQWGDDWIRGPLAATLDALFKALNADQKERIGWSSRPDLAGRTDFLAQDLSEKLKNIFLLLSCRVLIIADQFDDYQAQNRSFFLDFDGNWITPENLSKQNDFWGIVSASLRREEIHLLVVTRSDTSSGLSCVRFLDSEMIASRPLPKVESDFIRPLLKGIAPADEKVPVVSNPENGWTALCDVMEADFRSRGAILMQQVRTTLLGLRQLPTLTPKSYRAAGGMAGVETLVVARALLSASESLGGGEVGLRAARAILNSLVLPGSTQRNPKARRRAFSELVDAAKGASKDAVRRTLEKLQSNEIVRPAGIQASEEAWQLDHDYLARSVLAENRQADRWGVSLAEGVASYIAAEGAWRRKWKALLPITVQGRLLWEFLRGRLRYGSAAHYARLSALKPLLLVALVLSASVSVYWWNEDRRIRNTAQALVDRLDDQREDGKRAVLDIWSEQDIVRKRVISRLFESPGRLKAAGTNWVSATVALDASIANELLADIQEQLSRIDLDIDTRKALLMAYRRAASKMERGSRQVLSSLGYLRGELSKAGIDVDLRRHLLSSYSTAIERLPNGSVDAKAAATYLLEELNNTSIDAGVRSELLSAIAKVVGRLEEDSEQVKLIVEALERQLGEVSSDSFTFERSVQMAFAQAVLKLKPNSQGVRDLLASLAAKLGKGDIDPNVRSNLVAALPSVAKQLAKGDSVVVKIANHLKSEFFSSQLNDSNALFLGVALVEIVSRLEERTNFSKEIAAFILRENNSSKLNPNHKSTILRIFIPLLDFIDRNDEIFNDSVDYIMAYFDFTEGDYFSFPVFFYFEMALSEIEEGNVSSEVLLNRLNDKLEFSNIGPEVALSILRSVRPLVRRLSRDNQEVVRLARFIYQKLEKNEIYSDNRRELLVTVGDIAGRLKPDTGEVILLARIILKDLKKQNLNSDENQQVVSSLGHLARQMNEGRPELLEFTEYLRDQLKHQKLDSDAVKVLVDALAMVAEVPTQDQVVQAKKVTDVLVSMALPIRELERHPSLDILEKISRKSFQNDQIMAMKWAIETYGLPQAASRPVEPF